MTEAPLDDNKRAWALDARLLLPTEFLMAHSGAMAAGIALAGSRASSLLGGAIRVTREYIERLTTVDFTRDVALAASVMLEGEEILIGVAR